jgi:D-arginine dehydrogenase
MSHMRRKLTADILIIGAGMAGASVAWHLRGRARVLLIEQEAFAGYHATGRSAAFYVETYGGPGVQPLSTASKSFLFGPPDNFSDASIVEPRGALHIARDDHQTALSAMYDTFKTSIPALARFSRSETVAIAPMLKPAWAASALYDPDCMDMNVAALHAGYVRGAEVHANEKAISITRQSDIWHVETGASEIEAPVIVNASGAWGDDIAALAGVMPLGLTPCRRTIVAFKPDNMAVNPHAPLVLDRDDTFYFKPDGEDIWASPADETPYPACDVQADELDVALALDRVESATTYQIRTVKRKWAGLRTFAPDRLPVYGFDSQAPGFFWCVGQGGWGIQTAPAAGQLCAALLLEQPLPDVLLASGVTASRYAPARLRQRG